METLEKVAFFKAMVGTSCVGAAFHGTLSVVPPGDTSGDIAARLGIFPVTCLSPINLAGSGGARWQQEEEQEQEFQDHG